MSDLVGNHEDRFSQNEARFVIILEFEQRVMPPKDADRIANTEVSDRIAGLGQMYRKSSNKRPGIY